ncbi:MAG: hypothetical protein HN828_01475 [Candidatus Thioglobus sp.]|jgi:hypothetical protein|uniref:hypothetical protein n=1 Tax=Candidatus Thioglobus sp. TaxID=2026721 RepID=UPI0001BD36AE|nr:hypothetical protein [Candidatus Thioglobus sp.]EEZ80337.1 MAG: hypothetical protein Sup05_1099 [uncultured Candidatus Thioglobus sp.]MBT3186196.1 hypothetical protein [Candidatus Thioglobus sp.]MBT3431628.1 hypothetical protein [Candidatus Thioglobus sp.]MBT3965491.1 hypothetical protein [Candidatus Thioglobus sp.]MBT4315887.1 hypothetical protein [Candidatus Thioglobus sp.]
MIKFILFVVIVLALIGGAIQFKATDESWSLVVNKEAALNSVQNGAIKIYDFGKELVSDADKIKGVDLTLEK